jgi:HlyD family secretion protein
MLAEHSVESLYALHGTQRPWIYWLILAVLALALAVLPLVSVETSVRSIGVVRPANQRIELKAAVGGRVARLRAGDNDRVTANQLLLELAAFEPEERLSRNRAVQRERSGIIADLHELTGRLVPRLLAGEDISSESAEDFSLHTPVLAQEWARFLAQYAIHRMAGLKAQRIQARTSELARHGVVPGDAMDDAQHAADRTAADLELFIQQALAAWQTQLRDEETTLGQLISEERRLLEELTLACIRAPAAGTVQGLIGLSPGALVVPGQILGVLSPDAPLLVETYVAPKDIGLLRLGQVVRMQIDAFPYPQWGLLDGVVQDVGADAIPSGTQTVFKVLVQPMALALHLPNGATGVLRRGMTLTARFVIGRRSLLQILFEDASAWLGPQTAAASP